jgi:hypothetical protein
MNTDEHGWEASIKDSHGRGTREGVAGEGKSIARTKSGGSEVGNGDLSTDEEDEHGWEPLEERGVDSRTEARTPGVLLASGNK